MMITVYGNEDDPQIKNIISLCFRLGLDYEVRSTQIEANLVYLYDRGHTSVPQVFDNDVHIGSADDLVAYIELVTKMEGMKDANAG